MATFRGMTVFLALMQDCYILILLKKTKIKTLISRLDSRPRLEIFCFWQPSEQILWQDGDSQEEELPVAVDPMLLQKLYGMTSASPDSNIRFCGVWTDGGIPDDLEEHWYVACMIPTTIFYRQALDQRLIELSWLEPHLAGQGYVCVIYLLHPQSFCILKTSHSDWNEFA